MDREATFELLTLFYLVCSQIDKYDEFILGARSFEMLIKNVHNHYSKFEEATLEKESSKK